MGRRSFTTEFKHEAVKLVAERGMTVSQAAKDLGLHVNVLRAWVRDAKSNGTAAFPGRGKQRPDLPSILHDSLLSGLVTETERRGIQLGESMVMTGHKSMRRQWATTTSKRLRRRVLRDSWR